MHESTHQYSHIDTLTDRLTGILIGKGATDRDVAVIERKPNILASIFPTEIVTCRYSDGREDTFFVKYDSAHFPDSCGHRNNVEYEISVYRDILDTINTTTPSFIGSFCDPQLKSSVLVLEFLDDFSRYSRAEQPETILKTVRWLAGFHTATEKMLAGAAYPFLRNYTTDYYLGWVRRTVDFTMRARKDSSYPWLVPLCNHFERIADELPGIPPVIIHGEFYPQNVLLHKGIIRPVDWQTAAIAPGEIDLAAATDGWKDDIKTLCTNEYRTLRWPESGSEELDRRVDLSRLYLQFRWLGDNPDGIRKETWCIDQLYSIGKKMGLL